MQGLLFSRVACLSKQGDLFHSLSFSTLLLFLFHLLANLFLSEGSQEKHEFQAETRRILDIVAKSLYTEREIFIREIVSNASDALEKVRYMNLTGKPILEPNTPLEINITTDFKKRLLIIQVCFFPLCLLCIVLVFD